MYYLSSVNSVTTHLHISGLLVAHHQEVTINTGHTQKYGAVEKVNKKFISHFHGHNIHRQQRQLLVAHALPCATSSSKPCTRLTLHCNHRSGHLKTEHKESLFLLQRHLENWPRSKHEIGRASCRERV
jgi:hypothetical protein